MVVPEPVHRRASFSRCRCYRYELWREWADAEAADGYLLIIGLNPSTADARVDDPTIRRCMDFARRFGYRRLCVVNLFAWRATRPADLKAAPDPVGPRNNTVLKKRAAAADRVIAAWGSHGGWQGRADAVASRLSDLHCLRINRDGQPAHPLYLPAGLQPRPWR